MKPLEIIGAIAIFLFFLVVAVDVIHKSTRPYDSTDPSDGRSGLRLYIDDGTGCHYLGSSNGGLTPRMNPDGRQVCGAL